MRENNKFDLKIFERIDVGLLSDPSSDFAINFLFLKVNFSENEKYAIVLKSLPVPKDVKTFSKEEFVEVIHSLAGKALEERPHDFNLLVKDFLKVYKTLAELYPDKKF